MPSAKELIALADSFDWQAWQKKLEPKFAKIYRGAVDEIGGSLADQHDVDFNIDDPFISKHITKYVGERITQLEGTSKDRVIETIRDALDDADESAGVQELTDKIMDAVGDLYDDFERSRALRIARTETAITYNSANVLGARAAGFDEVDVTDGTGENSCDDCIEVNGQVWSVEDALNEPLEHPGCERAFFAHVDDGTHDDEDETEKLRKRRGSWRTNRQLRV